MREIWYRSSIRVKLLTILMLSGGLAVLFTGVSMLAYLRQSVVENHIESLYQLASVTGQNSQAALVFDLKEDAEKLLARLGHRTTIDAVYVVDIKGAVFATYPAKSQVVLPTLEGGEGHLVQDGYVWVKQIIELDGRKVGSIYIKDNLAAIERALMKQMSTLGGVLILALLVAYLIGSRMQNIVVDPLEDLSETAERVRLGQDYSVRARVWRPDEIGNVVTSFNSMLGEVEASTLELGKSEARFRALTEHSTDITLIIGGAGKLLYISPTYSDHIQNVEGSQLMGLVHKNDVEVLSDAIGRCEISDNALPIPIQFRLLVNGKTYLILDGRLTNMCDVAGVNGVVFNGHDMTEQRTLEMQLQQAHKMESIGQLAGGIAHDFNNLLGGIMGIADVLALRLRDQPELARFTEQIISTSERAADLTSQLLAFSRKTPLAMKTVDIHGIIGEVEQLLIHTIDKRIDLKLELKAKQSKVHGDASQLQNAILNLGVNARDAMAHGGSMTMKTVDVNLDEEFCQRQQYDIKPGTFVKIEVTDTGSGMGKDTMARVFEPFFTTKEVGKGTGLGLAAVYGTIKSHHGAINIYSEIGHGTSITLFLPKVEGESNDSSCLVNLNLNPLRGEGKILIIDDEETIRLALSTILTEIGYDVIEAVDGMQGLGMYGKNSADIDLVVLDVMMPHLSGEEVLASIRSINPDVKVVIASGFSDNNTLDRIRDLGIQGFIRKPFVMRDLAEVVKKALR